MPLPGSSDRPAPILIAGPTASGKSEVAAWLAEQLPGEIVSVDSMQVYRGLDIGTAKPDPEERRRVPYHLIDVVGLSEPFDAARFVRLATGAIGDIQGRGLHPILCGGTGLYFKALLEGLGEAPPSDPALRCELERRSVSELTAELARLDPLTFQRIDRQNRRRLVRALEVIRLTGQRYSTLRTGWNPDGQPLVRYPFFGIRRVPSDLHRRIEARVDRMFERGLVAETEALLQQGLARNPTALQALGYRQVAEFLDCRRSLAETIEFVKARTRQYAKRQMTWFRHQAQLTWIDANEKTAAAEIGRQIFAALPTITKSG